MSQQILLSGQVLIRPTALDIEGWAAYWEAQGQPWRTEPEIDPQRQKYLKQRRSITPIIERNIYPFKDIKLSRADVEWLLASHENGRGPVDWSDKEQREHKGLDLRGAVLSRVNLSGLPLACIQGGLSVSNIYAQKEIDLALPTDEQFDEAGVHLEGALLSKAHLEGANLRGAWITGAKLEKAYLEQGILELAYMEDADLRQADLRGALLEKVLLDRAILEDAHLEGASCSMASMQQTRLAGAHLEEAKLIRANMVSCKLQTASLSRADLTEAHLERAILNHADFTQAFLTRTSFQGSNLTSAKLKEANLDRAHLEQANLSSALIEGASFQEAYLEGAFLHGVHAEGADFSHAHLEGASIQSAHLEHANLSQACLAGATLMGTHLEGADLRSAYLASRSMPTEDFQRIQKWNYTSLFTTDFQKTQQPADLRRVYFDSYTQLDECVFASGTGDAAAIGNVSWGGANLTVVNWETLRTLGDERFARQMLSARKKHLHSNRPDQNERQQYDQQIYSQLLDAQRAYRQMALVLQNQGLNEDAVRFAYRAQILQRQISWFRMLKIEKKLRQRIRALGSWLFSWFLSLLAGYGYRPWRSFLAYLVVIGIFTALYIFLDPRLFWYEAIVVSMTAFHGRGFSPSVFNPGDPLSIASAFEAFVGLIIEVTFIATLTRRFFGQ